MTVAACAADLCSPGMTMVRPKRLEGDPPGEPERETGAKIAASAGCAYASGKDAEYLQQFDSHIKPTVKDPERHSN